MDREPQLTADEMLAEDMGRFFDDPLGFVMYAYDWDNDPNLRVVRLEEPWAMRYGKQFGPDVWACKELDAIGEMVRKNNFDGINPVAPIRRATGSGHGIGKSAFVGWLVDWIMSTRPFARGTVTANTAEQLSTKTWAEISKWTKRCITGHWFTITTGKGAMKMVRKGHEEEWFCSAQTCREENSESFAGQHAANSTSFYIFDEASAVPNKIDEVSEGGLTDGEPMKFAFGNLTRNTGWFADCFRNRLSRWTTAQIDSRTVQITNKKLIQEWIDDYGLDSDFVKIRVRGMLPSIGSKQLISVTDADAAMGRHLRPEQYEFAPKILTLDNSWEGDDEGAIGLRQGLRFEILRTFAKNDNDIEIANLLMRLEDEHKADAVFIDGGYGTGVVSAGRTVGREWTLVWFGAKALDPGCANKRAEMWLAARDWLKQGGSFPLDYSLHRDLISPETVPRMDGVIQLEAKKDMKGRGLASPNRGDALALSFAFPVLPKHLQHRGTPDANAREHNPFASDLGQVPQP